MVGELMPEDTLSVEFGYTNNDYFALEFFQVEVYYTMNPTQIASKDV